MFKKKPKKEESKTDVEEELKDAEKIEPEQAKKEEKPAEKPKEPAEKPGEEKTASVADYITNLYEQMETMGTKFEEIEKQIAALKANQIWIQEFVKNAMEATEVSK